MPDVRLRFWRARDGDDVKAYFLSYPIFLHVVVDGQLQTPLLAEVDGFFGFTASQSDRHGVTNSLPC